jgi:hypothetical protein
MSSAFAGFHRTFSNVIEAAAVAAVANVMLAMPVNNVKIVAQPAMNPTGREYFGAARAADHQ